MCMSYYIHTVCMHVYMHAVSFPLCFVGDVSKTPGRLEPPYKYTMTNQLHGNALIINNVNYKTPLTVRYGSNEDKI